MVGETGVQVWKFACRFSEVGYFSVIVRSNTSGLK